jgi:hypothetical protein
VPPLRTHYKHSWEASLNFPLQLHADLQSFSWYIDSFTRLRYRFKKRLLVSNASSLGNEVAVPLVFRFRMYRRGRDFVLKFQNEECLKLANTAYLHIFRKVVGNIQQFSSFLTVLNRKNLI